MTSKDFLIAALVPAATVITASVEDAAADVLAKLPEGAAAFLFHLNCTMTSRFPRGRDELIRELESRGIAVLNRNATNISKKFIQGTCLKLGLNTTWASPSGDDDEMVIVKTNLNFGGASEWALSEEQRKFLGLGRGSDIIWQPNHYRVIPRKDVDPRWWDDESLICEKYVSNKDDRWYRAYLLLNRVVITELVCSYPVKKVGVSQLTHSWRCTLQNGDAGAVDPGCPHNLIRDLEVFIRGSELEFGTVDVLMDDAGQAYVIDVNTTPAYNYPVPDVSEHLGGIIAKLTE